MKKVLLIGITTFIVISGILVFSTINTDSPESIEITSNISESTKNNVDNIHTSYKFNEDNTINIEIFNPSFNPKRLIFATYENDKLTSVEQKEITNLNTQYTTKQPLLNYQTGKLIIWDDLLNKSIMNSNIENKD